jgi:hypothetical protein
MEIAKFPFDHFYPENTKKYERILNGEVLKIFCNLLILNDFSGKYWHPWPDSNRRHTD